MDSLLRCSFWSDRRIFVVIDKIKETVKDREFYMFANEEKRVSFSTIIIRTISNSFYFIYIHYTPLIAIIYLSLSIYY